MAHRLWQMVEAHLASGDVARIIYGAVVGLALDVALQVDPPSSADVAELMAATAVALGLAEFYSEFIGAQARRRQRVSLAQSRTMARNATTVAVGAGFPAVFFVLAALGAISEDLAFNLSKWSGLGLICGYGFLAARLVGSGLMRSVLYAGVVGFAAALLITLKAFLH